MEAILSVVFFFYLHVCSALDPCPHRETVSSWTYIEVPVPDLATRNSVVFAVESCKDAHIALSETSGISAATTNMVEVVIGAGGNAYQRIGSSPGGGVLSTKNDKLLSCTEYRTFWLSWSLPLANTPTQVSLGLGEQVGNNTHLTASTEKPLVVNHVSIASYGTTVGKWAFDFPEQTKPELCTTVSPTTTTMSPTTVASTTVFQTPTASATPSTTVASTTLFQTPTAAATPSTTAASTTVFQTPTAAATSSTTAASTTLFQTPTAAATPSTTAASTTVFQTPTAAATSSTTVASTTVFQTPTAAATPSTTAASPTLSQTPTADATPSTTAASSTASPPTTSTKPNCRCKCARGTNATQPVQDAALELAVAEIKKNLTIQTETSAQKRSRTSALDPRPSSRAIGVLGAVMLAAVFGLIVAFDLMTLWVHLAKAGCRARDGKGDGVGQVERRCGSEGSCRVESQHESQECREESGLETGRVG